MNIAAFVISVVSIVFAGISLFYSIKSQNLQNKVNEIEYKLKQYERKRQMMGRIEIRSDHPS